MAHQKTERNPLFAGRWFDDDIILLCLHWYFRFKLSYRDLVAILGERGLSISHTTILRWVIRYAETCEKRWNRFERQVGGSWVRRRRPCFKHSRRPIHGGIFNRNSDHPNLSPLLAERIPKRPMRGSPRAEFTIRLVARIDLGKGDDFRVHGKDRWWRGTR